MKKIVAGAAWLMVMCALLSSAPSHVSAQPEASGAYSGLQRMPVADVKAVARRTEDRKIDVSIENPPGGPLAFFLRISLVDPVSGKRVLPVFYSDNYISVPPGEKETITIECPPRVRTAGTCVSVSGWNVLEKQVRIE